jgi:FlaA1/EpsC-like NDP-sugar epimerase
MEENVCAAVKTNIKGAKLLIDTSCKHNIARFLFISTDKAVEPISVMGKTKRVVEEYLLFKQTETTTTQLSILRLCNVYDSSGSVVPVFKARIQQQLPLEIKGKEVRRAFIQKALILELVLKLLKFEDSAGLYIPGQTNLLTVERIAEKLLKEYADTSIENYPITYLTLPEYEKQEELLYSSREQIDASSEDVLAKVFTPKPKLNLERLKHCILAAEAFDGKKAQQFLDELTAYV